MPDIPPEEQNDIVVPELWIADSTGWTNAQQIGTYDGTVNTNQYMFKVVLDQDYSSVKLSVFDDTIHDTPATKQALIGTSSSNNTSLIKAIETTSGAPSEDWTSVTDDIYDLESENNMLTIADPTSGDKYLNLVVYLVDDLTYVEDTFTISIIAEI
ncbi:MAG: hypothetical protein ACTSQY_01035 [Candidatus Odinarchaeia archaeon]